MKRNYPVHVCSQVVPISVNGSIDYCTKDNSIACFKNFCIIYRKKRAENE